MLDIAQMSLTDADTFGKLLLLQPAGTAPVSYTHLDVYKRQTRYTGKNNSCFITAHYQRFKNL